MGTIRRTHTTEFKFEAVRLITEKRLGVAQAPPGTSGTSASTRRC